MAEERRSWDELLAARLADWQAQGLGRELRVASGVGMHFTFQGKPVLSFASNDYLGLATHPDVLAAARAALDAQGAGATASPLICGHTALHAALERELATFKRSAAALVFASGYHAALATISALAGKETTVLLDRLAHASLIDGARLSGARVRAFKHNDAADLAQLLTREEPRRCLVVIESLYSMDGDVAPLEEFVRLTEERGALLLVDEAHATGVLGIKGRGGLEAETRARGGLPAHVVALGTLSKALGSQGGFICASELLAQIVLHAGRAYMFSTALAPAAVAAASAALHLIDVEPERRRHMHGLAAALREQLADFGAHVVPGEGPIIPVLCGDEERAVRLSRALFEKGMLVPAVRYPTVKRGQARLRISVNANHALAECEALVAVLREMPCRNGRTEK
jgi:8-amino-7-oxononanoate synthase